MGGSARPAHRLAHVRERGRVDDDHPRPRVVDGSSVVLGREERVGLGDDGADLEAPHTSTRRTRGRRRARAARGPPCRTPSSQKHVAGTVREAPQSSRVGHRRRRRRERDAVAAALVEVAVEEPAREVEVAGMSSCRSAPASCAMRSWQRRVVAERRASVSRSVAQPGQQASIRKNSPDARPCGPARSTGSRRSTACSFQSALRRGDLGAAPACTASPSLACAAGTRRAACPSRATSVRSSAPSNGSRRAARRASRAAAAGRVARPPTRPRSRRRRSRVQAHR